MPFDLKKPMRLKSAKKIDAGVVEACFPPDELASLDAWIGAHRNTKPTRADAVRELVRRGLQAETAQDASDRQRLNAFETTAAARAAADVARSDARQIDRQVNEGGPAIDRSRAENRAVGARRAKDRAVAAVDIALQKVDATDDQKEERKRRLVKRPRTNRIASS